MNSYLIPREIVDENRFLIFTKTSAIFTMIGLIIGVAFFYIFKIFSVFAGWLNYVGIAFLVLTALVFFVIGSFNIPESNTFDFFKKTGGEPIWEIIKRVYKFNKSKKIYVYERR